MLSKTRHMFLCFSEPRSYDMCFEYLLCYIANLPHNGRRYVRSEKFPLLGDVLGTSALVCSPMALSLKPLRNRNYYEITPLQCETFTSPTVNTSHRVSVYLAFILRAREVPVSIPGQETDQPDRHCCHLHGLCPMYM
jgi:hypothetical protein